MSSQFYYSFSSSLILLALILSTKNRILAKSAIHDFSAFLFYFVKNLLSVFCPFHSVFCFKNVIVFWFYLGKCLELLQGFCNSPRNVSFLLVMLVVLLVKRFFPYFFDFFHRSLFSRPSQIFPLQKNSDCFCFAASLHMWLF